MAVVTNTGTLYDGQYVLVVNWGEAGTGEIESEITGLAPTSAEVPGLHSMAGMSR